MTVFGRIARRRRCANSLNSSQSRSARCACNNNILDLCTNTIFRSRTVDKIHQFATLTSFLFSSFAVVMASSPQQLFPNPSFFLQRLLCIIPHFKPSFELIFIIVFIRYLWSLFYFKQCETPNVFFCLNFFYKQYWSWPIWIYCTYLLKRK